MAGVYREDAIQFESVRWLHFFCDPRTDVMGGYVYILRSETSGRFYVGSAVDPERRLQEHLSGHVKATRNRGPWVRVGLVAFDDATTARKAEYWLKSLRDRRLVQQVCDGTFVWPSRFSGARCETL